jgi:ATP-dependent exoDNAse (exonuclease V) beta subunit
MRLFDTFDSSSSAPDSRNKITPTTGVSIDETLDSAVEAAIASFEEIDSPRKKTASALKTLKKFREARRRFARGGPDVTWGEWARLAGLEANKDGDDSLERVRDAAGRILSHPGFKSDMEMMVRGAFGVAADALELYDDYKTRRGLMDFADQEVKVLALAIGDSAFRASIADRLSRMMVDEFQDTNPIQLALFLALGELAGDSEWVGDPKQAIYGFRGTDPQLMDEATKNLETSKVLSGSWRSKDLLVNFFNAVFVEVFKDMGEDRVRLHIPEDRSVAAAGGRLELWRLVGKNKNHDAAGVAEGIRALLEGDVNLSPGDVAVLCRKGVECEAIASALEAAGVNASVPRGALLDVPECLLAVAALRYMHDDHDTGALTEIIHFTHGLAGDGKWLASLIEDRDGCLENWRRDPIAEALSAARENMANRTPLEALKAAIDIAGLPRAVKSWTRPESRMNNLGALCGACREYMEGCGPHRRAATASGFINHLYAVNPKGAEGFGRDTVQVSTYHKAKGLEWPVVVLFSLDDSFAPSPFGVHIVPSPSFDIKNPLGGRSIRYWPKPFEPRQKLPILDDTASVSAEAIQAMSMDAGQSRRLMYVGMTRARDTLIFAARLEISKTNGETLKTGWLDELTNDEPLILWPGNGGTEVVVDAQNGRKNFPMTVRDFTGETASADAARREEYFLPSLPLAERIDFSPATLQPSGLPGNDSGEPTFFREAADFGARLPISGKPDMGSLGSAIHAFLAEDPGYAYKDFNASAPERLEMSRMLLENWGVEKSMAPEDLLAVSERFESFLAARYGGAKIYREHPVTARRDDGTSIQGWIDVLVETQDSYAIIDHKSWPGERRDLANRVEKYAAQLAAYKEAVERATGKPVSETLIHLPVSGMVIEIGNH